MSKPLPPWLLSYPRWADMVAHDPQAVWRHMVRLHRQAHHLPQPDMDALHPAARAWAAAAADAPAWLDLESEPEHITSARLTEATRIVCPRGGHHRQP